jgi:hypothetical protein
MEGFLAALEATEYEAEEQDVTEPMPALGSDDTTVRIPTPPGREPVTPALGPVDETAPETTEPPSAPETAEPEPGVEMPEPWAAPGPTRARRDPDTPPPWTPTPAVAPWAAPPVSEPSSITPEPAVGRPDETETVGVGAVGVGAVDERPRGVPRSLLIGGGAAAVFLVGALFLFGPLRPVAPDRAAQLTEGEPVAEAVPPSEQAQPAGGPGVVEPEREPTPAGPGQEVQVAGAEVGQPGPTTGPEEAAGEGAVEETPAAEPAELPPAEESPVAVERGDRTRAEQAGQRAEELQDAAAAAVSDADHRRTLDQLDTELAAAREQFVAGHFADAERAFVDLAGRYEALAESARVRAAARASEIARERRAAEQARNDALAQRQAAINAGAQRFFADDFANQERAKDLAEQTFRDSSYASARSLFLGVTRGYEQLTEQARRELQSRAASARMAMQQQREAALAVGAEGRAADRLAETDEVRDRGQTEFGNRSYAEALAHFQEAERAYMQLAEELAAQPVEEEQPAAAADLPAEEVMPPEEAGATSDEVAIGDLIERFRQAFELEDLERMGAEVYKGEVPSGDARFLRDAFFDRADSIRAELRLEDLRFDGLAAVAHVEINIEFRQARTRQSETYRQRLRLQFVSGPDGWRLERLRR